MQSKQREKTEEQRLWPRLPHLLRAPCHTLHAFSGLVIMTGLPGKSSHPITQRRKLSWRNVKGCVPLAQWVGIERCRAGLLPGLPAVKAWCPPLPLSSGRSWGFWSAMVPLSTTLLLRALVSLGIGVLSFSHVKVPVTGSIKTWTCQGLLLTSYFPNSAPHWTLRREGSQDPPSLSDP